MDAELLAARPGEDVRELARRALEDRPKVLVAAGGDGTVSAIAGMVRGTDTALGVLPMGTLNHFARDLRIPLELDKAVRTIAEGRRVAVDTGDVNGICFLNNSSLGLYPDIVRERKRQQRRLGRSKRSAMLWATFAVLNRTPLLELDLELPQRRQVCSAPFIFIGNNEYVMEGFSIGTRERLDAGTLSVYTTQRASAADLIMLALRALFGRLRQAEDFVAMSARSLRVASWRKQLLVAHDGEVTPMQTPLEYRILPRSLNVIVP
ncbi:MAG TPA: diacylglycerol kinase family protein [Burkholderiales bacterium]|nr:diacylglycerol kinase family protein [Burkholderiales bacterium]